MKRFIVALFVIATAMNITAAQAQTAADAKMKVFVDGLMKKMPWKKNLVS